jgi:hypothetical protein
MKSAKDSHVLKSNSLQIMSMNYFNNEAAKIDNDDKIIASKQCIT